MTPRIQVDGRDDGPTVVLLHGASDGPGVWDGVQPLLADRFRIVRVDHLGDIDGTSDVAAVVGAAGRDTVHVLAGGGASAAVFDYLAEPGAADRIASVTVAGLSPALVARHLRATLSRPRHPRRFARGVGQLARVAAMAPGALASRSPVSLRPVNIPVQLVVGADDRHVSPRFYDDVVDDMLAWAPRLWRRDVKAGDSAPGVLARSVTQLVDHLDGAPAARELLRAQVGRTRKAFGDTLVAVTGAASGIGRETALAFAREGADLILSDIDSAGLDDTAHRIEALGGHAFSYLVDVADADAVESFAARACADHGVPDIVVNNAGVGQAGFFLDTPADEFDRVLDINLGGVVNGCRSFGKRLVERGTGGHIVNVASMASYTPVNVMNAYCTSKAAVYMFSDCLRAELDSYGIGLTTICPGIIGTNIVNTTRFSLPQQRSDDAETIRRRARRAFAVRRVGPDRVATAIVAAVRDNKPVRPVTTEAYVVYGVAHAAPQAMRSAARGGKIM